MELNEAMEKVKKCATCSLYNRPECLACTNFKDFGEAMEKAIVYACEGYYSMSMVDNEKQNNYEHEMDFSAVVNKEENG